MSSEKPATKYSWGDHKQWRSKEKLATRQLKLRHFASGQGIPLKVWARMCAEQPKHPDHVLAKQWLMRKAVMS